MDNIRRANRSPLFVILDLMPNQTSFNWKIAGAAGAGIKSAGETMAKAFLRSGFNVFGYTEYPSLIRGGHNTYQVHASTQPVTAPKIALDLLVALNQDAIDQHKEEVTPDTIIIKDPITKCDLQAKIVDIRMLDAAKELGHPILMNTISLGASAAHFGLPLKILEELVTDTFKDKKGLVESNVKALQTGFELYPNKTQSITPPETKQDRLIVSGNEAIALGAISAGLQYYAAYPMTPSTPVLHYLSAHQKEFGFFVRQVEDEISAINNAIGASYAGARSMTGTSGGGYALMNESVALAGMLEVPLVIFIAMRAGPATGMPTWTSQGDLRFVLHSGHGEFPKIVLAPGDATEAFTLTRHAFYLAQKYQTPVIVLSDKHLSESHYTSQPFDNMPIIPLMNIETNPSQPEGQMFTRYQSSPTGVSLRTIPGIKNGFHIANSDEHTAEGLADETAQIRTAMATKRLNKLTSARSDMKPPLLYGQPDAKQTIVGWGSTKGSVLQALPNLPDTNFLHFTYLWPLPDSVVHYLENRQLIFIENNLTGQFEGLIREATGVTGIKSLRKDDGRPFYPEEIIAMMKA